MAGLEQKQKRAESLVELITQPELQTLHSFEATPNLTQTNASSLDETILGLA